MSQEYIKQLEDANNSLQEKLNIDLKGFDSIKDGLGKPYWVRVSNLPPNIVMFQYKFGDRLFGYAESSGDGKYFSGTTKFSNFSQCSDMSQVMKLVERDYDGMFLKIEK